MKTGDKVKIKNTKQMVSNGDIHEVEGLDENGLIYLIGLEDLFFYKDELELI